MARVKIRVLRRVTRMCLRDPEVRDWAVRRGSFWCKRLGVSERVTANFLELLVRVMERIGSETGPSEFPYEEFPEE